MLTKRCSARELSERDVQIFSALHVHNLISAAHIGALFAHSKTHLHTLEQRLIKLARSGYIAQLTVHPGDDKQFMLRQKGMDALVARGMFPARRVRTDEPSLLFRPHELSLSDVTLSMSFTACDHSEPITLIDEHAIYSQASNAAVQSNRGWRVSISHPQFGRKQDHWVKPDRVIGYRFTQRPGGRNERHYIVEIDRSTMPLTGALDRPTILRKLLSYEVTIQSKKLFDEIGVRFPYVLFFAPSKRRRDNMVALAIEQVADPKAAQAMLFAVQPKPPRIHSYTPMTDIEWINGGGSRVCFPM